MNQKWKTKQTEFKIKLYLLKQVDVKQNML